jgi:RNA polymerase sigma-70 factor (ECF subfamily)
MRNTFINNYRKMKRLPEHVAYDDQISGTQMLPNEEGVKQAGKDLSELFEDEIASAIAALPERYKSVLVLRDIEELQYEEIAEAMEIPVGTVRSRLHRARAILFEALKDLARGRGYPVGERLQESLADA